MERQIIAALTPAVSYFGSVTALAKAVGYSRQNLYNIRNVSPALAMKIEVATGQVIRKETLRPDIWSPA